MDKNNIKKILKLRIKVIEGKDTPRIKSEQAIQAIDELDYNQLKKLRNVQSNISETILKIYNKNK